MSAAVRRPLRFLLPLAAVVAAAPAAVGRDVADAPPAGAPAVLVKAGGAVDEAVVGRVQNAALAVQRDAERAGQRGVFVLELTPGTSRFGPVRDLAQFLTSADLSDVRTVAWVPETVDGNNAILALACEEIVLHPDAELGDLGRGAPLDAADTQFVLTLAGRRHNRMVSPALARGLADPARRVLKVTLGEGADADVRLVSPEELKELRATAAGKLDVQIVKEAGVPGRFKGSQARALGVLATGTARTRADVADLYGLPALRTAAAAGGVPQVAYIRVDDVIEPIIGEFVKRQIDRSVAAGADLIVFELTTAGGYAATADDLARRIVDLAAQDVRTVAYVPEEAVGMGALLALACDEIYMRPGATLGAAKGIDEPDEIDGGDEASRSLTLATLRELAEPTDAAKSTTRPKALLEAMADPSLEVFAATDARTGRRTYLSEADLHAAAGAFERGPLVPESRAGALLVVDAARAAELGLVEPPVTDADELKQRLGVPADVDLQPVGKNWMDTLVFLLNTQTACIALIVAGLALAYLEAHFATGLLGILSVLCFGLFFWSMFLGGTAGWLEVLLFALGIGCLALELFVIPGFGVFGVCGGLLVLASLVMAMQTFGVSFSPERMTRSLGTLVAAMAGIGVFAAFTNRFLPSMPLFNRMVLAPPGFEVAGPALRPDLLDEAERRDLGPHVGDTGETRTTLRPAGKAEIGGDYLDVVSDGPFIDPDTPVRVVRLEGPRVFVRAIS